MNFNFPLITDSLLPTVVTSQNPVSCTIGGLKLHHFVFRNCCAFVGATSVENISRSSRLYKEQVVVLEGNF
jgi:hypothetical protein